MGGGARYRRLAREEPSDIARAPIRGERRCSAHLSVIPSPFDPRLILRSRRRFAKAACETGIRRSPDRGLDSSFDAADALRFPPL